MEEYQKQSLEKAISYCIEYFSTKEATKRIIDYIIRDRELTEQLRQYNVVGRSEQLVCPQCKSQNVYEFTHTDGIGCNSCGHQWAN